MSYPEGPDRYANAYARNRRFAKLSANNYQTPLTPQQEKAFRGWLKASGAPFDPNAPIVDYDMRGYWAETGGKGWKSGSHFPDTYKTPYDTTFSNQSKYATTDNPFAWKGDTLFDKRTGKDVGPTPVDRAPNVPWQGPLPGVDFPIVPGPNVPKPLPPGGLPIPPNAPPSGPGGRVHSPHQGMQGPRDPTQRQERDDYNNQIQGTPGGFGPGSNVSPQPPPGGAIYTPDGKGGGSFRVVTLPPSAPPQAPGKPILPRATPGDNPFRRSGDTVAAIQDPMARRFDALSPEDKSRLIRLGDDMKSGKVPMSVYSQEAQRLMIDQSSYGPLGSLPGEAGFFPPRPGPSPLAENMKFYAGKLGGALNFVGVLNQVGQTSRAISGAPAYAQGPMALGTMGTVGTAASAAGAAATGLPVAGVAGIGIAGAAVPMGIATTFGAASGQEGSDPWGGRKPYGANVAGPKKTSMGDTISAGPIVGPAGRDDELDHFDIGHAHGVLVGKQIKTQIGKAFATFQQDLHKHIQNGGVQP